LQNAVNTGQVTLYDKNGPINGPAFLANPSGYTVTGSKITDPTLGRPQWGDPYEAVGGCAGLQSIDPTKTGGFNAQFLDNLP